ncbi:hypothetical protein [Magnetovibrio sp.]|uniref:hypothetical protein n=1 Tax=Magnetovibrio sp. TaxID=2024836 RepID=UPI002F935B1A
MATLSQIRAAIQALIAANDASSTVHDFERYAEDEDEFRLMFVDGATDRINAWIIRRVSQKVASPSMGRDIVTNRWQVRKYLSFEDDQASEKTFDDQLEVVRKAIRADDDLGGLIDTMTLNEAAGLQVDDSGPVMFSGVLCHSARCTLFTQHYE